MNIRNLLSAMLYKPITEKDEYLFLKEHVGKDTAFSYFWGDPKAIEVVQKTLEEVINTMNEKEKAYFLFEMNVSKIVRKIEGNGVPISTELLQEMCNNNYQKDYMDSYKRLQSKCQSYEVEFSESFVRGSDDFEEPYTFLNCDLKAVRKKWRKKNLMDYAKLAKHIKNGRIYCTYSEYGTVTGRIQTKNPNVQGLPKKVREKCIVPGKGKGRALILADYSAEELVLAAIIAEDKKFILDIWNDVDFHSETAAVLFGKNISEVNKKERSIAKEVTFMTLYGAKPVTLEKKFSEEGYVVNGENIQKKILARYPMIEKIRSEIERNGFIQLFSGRKIDCATIGRKYTWVNRCIQSNASLVLKAVILELDAKLSSETQIVCLIHDEIMLEMNEENTEECAKIVRDTMENALKYFGIKEKMPVKIEVRRGEN